MWQGASEAKIAATRGYGAEVDLESADPTEAFARLDDLIEQTGRTPVHPFDDPRTIAGQGTVGLELVEDVPDVDVVVVPVGGGGLISGIATAVRGLKPDARVIGVEPELSPAMHEALAAGEPVPVSPGSIADGLAAPFAGTQRARDRPRARRARSCSSARTRSRRRCASCTRARSSPASRPARPPTAALLAGKVAARAGRDASSRSSRAATWPADTAVAILAGR